MEYITGIFPPLYAAILGAAIYIIYHGFKHGISSINEKEVVLIMFEFGAIISAIKVILLAFNDKIPLDSSIDRIYLVIAGTLTIMVTIKDIVSKF